MKLIRTCREVTELVLQGRDRPLGPVERLALRAHWLVCDGCRQFRRQAELMAGAMDTWRRYREDDRGL